MNARPVILHLVVAILGLGIGYRMRPVPATPTGAVQPRTVVKEEVAPPAPDIARSTDFNWKDIESTNYFVYVRNLRQIGCPEDTICDIIKSEVDKMFSERWAQTHKPFSEKRYWVAVPLPHLLKRREKIEIAKFDSEKAAVMQQLLGVSGGQCGCAEETSPLDRVSLSSDDKQKKASQILKDFEAQERQLDSETEFSTNKTEVAKARLKLIAEKRATLASVLDPEEIRRLELVVSPRARYLRDFLFGFQPTEEEFRGIYELWGANQMMNLSNNAGYATTPIADTRQALTDQFRNRLGEERYNRFRMESVPDYQNLSQIGQLLHWDATTLSPALAYITDYTKMEQQAMKEPQANIQNLRVQRDEKLRAILGEIQFEEYKKRRPRGGISSPQFQYW